MKGELEAGEAEGAQQLPRARKRLPLSAFALGLSASLLLGAASIRLLASWPALAAADRPPAAVGAALAQSPARLDMAIAVGDRPASFPLLVTGLEGLANPRVVLRNLPEALWFSRGERRDEHTWDLAGSDLDDLTVTLRPGTPQAFTLDIEVVAADAVPLAQSVAAVRLIHAASQAAADPSPAPVALRSAAPAEGVVAGAAAPDMAAFKWRTSISASQAVAREARARFAASVSEQPRPAASDPAWRTATLPSPPTERPAGMSALGAVSHEPAAEGRWLWWRLPALAWATARDGESARR
ncbi:MAG TPA: hypothetical protein VFR00_07910 [Hyphomicrobiaceae bacterium]|nr:hypothetical protein [Hyphomicrobiaceae bacterium]